MTYVDDDLRKQMRTELYNVKNSAPHIWEQLKLVGLCPYLFGLPTNCGVEKNCDTCWEQAMSLENTDEVKVSLTGRYFCVKCNQFLTKTDEHDNSRLYECPVCHTIYEMLVNEEGLVTSIINRGRREEKKKEVTDPNDPNYNQE